MESDTSGTGEAIGPNEIVSGTSRGGHDKEFRVRSELLQLRGGEPEPCFGGSGCYQTMHYRRARYLVKSYKSVSVLRMNSSKRARAAFRISSEDAKHNRR